MWGGSKIFSVFFAGNGLIQALDGSQRWVFEDAENGYHRIRNVRTGNYLTWDHNSGNVYGFHWVGPGHADYDGQLWWNH